MANRPTWPRAVRKVKLSGWTLLRFWIVALLVSPMQASACDIPVFRYALERWTADDYQLVVYHEGQLPTSAELSLKVLEETISALSVRSATSKGCNLRVVRVDLQQAIDEADYIEQKKYWSEKLEKEHSAKMPFAVLRTSKIGGKEMELWQGPLGQFPTQDFLQSPIRHELCKRLMRGDAIVWMVVKSRQDQKNDAVRKLLQVKSRELSQSLELPEGIGAPGSELYSEVPLLLEFSILEVNRDDKQESHLVELFSKLDPRAFADDEPLIIPVFGRGRALEVIPGRDLDAGMVGDLAVFLSGACSCQVKERNPGFDLLLKFDWHRELFRDGIAPPPPDEGLKATKLLPTFLDIPAGRKKSLGR